MMFKMIIFCIMVLLVVTMRSWGVVFGGVMLIFLSFVLKYEIQLIEIKQASRLLFGVAIVFGVSTVLIWLSGNQHLLHMFCLLYTSPSPRDQRGYRMPSSA